MSTASSGPCSRGKLTSFFLDDHRYVLLGTSVIAAVGMALFSSPHPALSFLAPCHALEVVMYCLLAAWVGVALVALGFKIALRDRYATCAPFARPAVKRALRWGSYVVGVITVVLAADRLGGRASFLHGVLRLRRRPDRRTACSRASSTLPGMIGKRILPA